MKYFASKAGATRFLKDRYLAAKVTWFDDKKCCGVVVKG